MWLSLILTSLFLFSWPALSLQMMHTALALAAAILAEDLEEVLLELTDEALLCLDLLCLSSIIYFDACFSDAF